MTEIRDAQEAMQNRHEALSKDTIGAMVFLRRLEKATCDPAFAAWKCPECGYQNEPMTSLCHGCSWDSSR